MALKWPWTPELLDALPEPLAELHRGLELKLLREICERLNLSGQLNEVTVQDIRALRSHGINLGEIQKAIMETTGIAEKMLNDLMDDVVERNQKYYTELITLAKVTAPQTLVDAADIAAIRRQTWAAYKNITGSTGFLVRQGGRLAMLEPAKAYHWALDSAVLQVQSGAISYNEAIRAAVRQLADSGLCVARDKDGNILKNHVQYESGYRMSLDSAVRTCVMTGVNQINQKYREQSMEYLETDLVEVTAHLGARNIGEGFMNHELWQGKIYHWKR